ncbi:CPBP family intramembrane glutamic endopeptidase [Palleronia sediminis]|uniref:CPBP family intramembrane glutamic endopeptidase n=1 Tax=Palleronia sediminis TaxID=2547833 RepID=UPI001F0E4249|nr:CPBP family intramembrane glutamic endopeptidase [Palleronia sediminis]
MPAFTDFVAPARRAPQVWRLLLGVLLCVVVFMLWVGGLFGAMAAALGLDAAMAWTTGMASPTRPTETLLLLSTFVGMALGPMLAVRLLHRRRVRTLFGPGRRVLRDFAIAAGLVAVVYSISMWMWSTSYDAEPNLAPELWLTLLPFAVVGILVQTGAEEMLFRGYLMQQLAARFSWRLIYMILPAVLFGMLHFDPGANGSNAWAIVGSAAFFGLISADLTIATGSLGAAWGLHFANNIVAILILSTKGTITGLALYLTPYAASEVEITGPMLLTDIVMVLVVWAALRLVLRG